MKNVTPWLIAVAIAEGCTRTPHAPALPSPRPSPSPVVQEWPVTCASTQAQVAVREGLLQYWDARTRDALASFQQAIAADPGCLQARALLAFNDPTAAGAKALDDVVADSQSSAMPLAERDYLLVLQARARGDDAKVEEIAARISADLPNSWVAQTIHGAFLLDHGHYPQAADRFQLAAALAPDVGAIQNLLGYAYLQQDQFMPAVAALRRYADLSPDEPNAQDSYGEVLLRAGRLAEAEDAFRKALEIDPGFGDAWSGIGFCRFYSGDEAGGVDAFTHWHDKAGLDQDKLVADEEMAWALEALGHRAEARKALAREMSEARSRKMDVSLANAALQSAMFAQADGKPAEVLAALADAAPMLSKAAAAGAPKSQQATRLLVAIRGEAEAGHAAKAKAALDELRTLAATQPEPVRKDWIAFGEGRYALFTGDANVAATTLAGCDRANDLCRLELATAQERSGHLEAAEATRALLARTWRRDGVSLWVHQTVARVTPR